MTQELQARLYDVLRLVVGSDIAQPEEREFALATAVELTKEYPARPFYGWDMAKPGTESFTPEPNVEGPFDRDEAAKLGDEFGIEFTLFGSVKQERFRHTHGSWRVQVGREWADASAWAEDLFTPVHNLAWAKWAMKQGVELVYNEGHRYRWANGEVEIRCDDQWGRSIANHDSWMDTEDWQVAK